MQKKNSPNWVIIGACVFCNAVCAGLWFFRGFSWAEVVALSFLAALPIWLLVALLWCVRMMRRPRKKDSGDAPDNALR